MCLSFDTSPFCVWHIYIPYSKHLPEEAKKL